TVVNDVVSPHAAHQTCSGTPLAVPLSSVVRRSLSDDVPQPGPPNVRDERNRPVADLTAALRVVVARAGDVREVHEERPPSNVRLGHDPPVPAVLRAVAVVAHHEIVIGRNEQRAPVVERGLRGWRTEPRALDLDLVLPIEVRVRLRTVALVVARSEALT